MTPPLTYTAHDGRRHFHRSHIALVCMSLGFVTGLIFGVMTRTVRHLESSEPAWKPAMLVCVAESHDGEIHSFTLENRTGKDYTVTQARDWQIFSQTPRGLEPARDAALSVPIFIPKSERVIVSITCPTHGAFVVFDMAHHSRIDLCAR